MNLANGKQGREVCFPLHPTWDRHLFLECLRRSGVSLGTARPEQPWPQRASPCFDSVRAAQPPGPHGAPLLITPPRVAGGHLREEPSVRCVPADTVADCPLVFSLVNSRSPQ